VTGHLIKEENPADLRFYSVPAQNAQDLTKKLFADYTKLPSNSINRLLSNPEILNRLKVKVTGLPWTKSLQEQHGNT